VTTGPTDARPIQWVISDDIREKIEAGELPPGEKLPTYKALARQYGCSEAPVRQAVTLLRNQGLVVSRQGKGTYVRDRAPVQRHSASRYRRSLWQGGQAVLEAEAAQQGLTAGQVITFIGQTPAPPRVAERLGVAPGTPVFARRRITSVNGRPNQLADSYYPLDVAERVPALTREHTGPGGGFARIEDAGIILAGGNERSFPRMPTGPEARTLKLPPGTPVMDLIRTMRDRDGRAVEVMRAVIAGDTIVFDDDFEVTE
jgi:GntR family transcriptional regulator